MQLVEPTIPVRLGHHQLIGSIVNYEDATVATVQITLYNYGPPITEINLYRTFPWLEVHQAWSTRWPLTWY